MNNFTLAARVFLGALPPVDLRAVCLVRAISIQSNSKTAKFDEHKIKELTFE